MPKVIENIRKDLISKGEKILVEEGPGALTMRRMAKECGIAPGTIYNYFQSKEELQAVIILQKWRIKRSEIIESMRATDVKENLRILYRGVLEFALSYRPLWREEPPNKLPLASDLMLHHQALVEDLKELVATVYAKCNDKNRAKEHKVQILCTLIAENILLSVRYSNAEDMHLFDTFLELL